MKLLRYETSTSGTSGGQEKPGLLDETGVLRDLSGIVDDIACKTLLPENIERLRNTDPASLTAVNGNPRLQRRILSGEVNSGDASRKEREVLKLLIKFEQDKVPLETALEAVLEYESFFDPKADREVQYRQTLTDRPWMRCECEVCTDIGIHVIIFRGAERNRRRGFHNIQEFSISLSEALEMGSSKSTSDLSHAG